MEYKREGKEGKGKDGRREEADKEGNWSNGWECERGSVGSAEYLDENAPSSGRERGSGRRAKGIRMFVDEREGGSEGDVDYFKGIALVLGGEGEGRKQGREESNLRKDGSVEYSRVNTVLTFNPPSPYLSLPSTLPSPLPLSVH